MKTYACARVEVGIRASLPAVWQLICDVERWPEWTPTVESLAALRPGRLAVGASYRIKQPGLQERVYVVTSLDDGREFSWESATWGVQMLATHEAWSAGDETRVRLAFALSGFLAPMINLTFRRKIESMVRLEGESLRRRAEHDASATATAPTVRWGISRFSG